MPQTPAGTHCILELYGCPSDLLNDVPFVCEAVEHASKQSLSTLIKLSSHQYQPQGVTVVGLLAESHISVHTWPEHRYVAIDIFTCGQSAEPRAACDFLVKHFHAQNHYLTVLSRGNPGTPPLPQDPDENAQEAHLCQAPN